MVWFPPSPHVLSPAQISGLTSTYPNTPTQFQGLAAAAALVLESGGELGPVTLSSGVASAQGVLEAGSR